MTGDGKNLLQTINKNKMLSSFVIDEAHCISHWGHDFREDYAKLKCLRQLYPQIPIAALTATATPRVAKDIFTQLGISKPKM